MVAWTLVVVLAFLLLASVASTAYWRHSAREHLRRYTELKIERDKLAERNRNLTELIDEMLYEALDATIELAAQRKMQRNPFNVPPFFTNIGDY